MNDITYRLGAREDLEAIQALLTQGALLPEGIERLTDHCLVAKADSRLVGVVALEPCGRWALMRSLAVAPDCRRRSLGRNLCGRLISHARLLGVEQLFLLTTDAEKYFAALGFQRMERSQAPPQIQATSQFRSLCPKSAVCMVRDISHDAIHVSTEFDS